jgi:hypothetical protein
MADILWKLNCNRIITKYIQGVPKKNPNYWNNVLLEFECLSTLLNPQVHNFVPYLALLLGWARVLHNSNYITIQLYNYITLQLYTHIYTSTYIYPYNLLSPPDHFPNYVTVYDCRMLLGLRGLHACPWRYPWTVLCVLRTLKLTGLHFPWHSRSFQTPHFHSDLKFLKIICRNNQWSNCRTICSETNHPSIQYTVWNTYHQHPSTNRPRSKKTKHTRTKMTYPHCGFKWNTNNDFTIQYFDMHKFNASSHMWSVSILHHDIRAFFTYITGGGGGFGGGKAPHRPHGGHPIQPFEVSFL